MKMQNHIPEPELKSKRFIGLAEAIDIKKLERETRKLLCLGFVVAIVFHAALTVFFMSGKTTVDVVRSIPVELVAKPLRMKRPFTIEKKDSMKEMQLRKQFVTGTPSGEFKLKSPLSEMEREVIPDSVMVNMLIEMIKTISAEIDTVYREETIVRIKEKRFKDEDYDIPLPREPDHFISLKEEMLSIDDLDSGQYKGLVVQDLADIQKIKGFVYIPANTWSAWLKPAQRSTVIRLMHGFKKYTGISVKIDPHLFLSSPSLHKYPFIYISAGRGFELYEREISNLRKYFLNGGFALIDPYSLPAYAACRQMIKDSLQDYARIRPIPFDYPIYHCFFNFKEMPVLFPPLDEGSFENIVPLDGVWVNNRLIAVLPPSPYNPFGQAWSSYKSENSFENPRFRMAVNIVVFSLIRKESKARMYVNSDVLRGDRGLEFLKRNN